MSENNGDLDIIQRHEKEKKDLQENIELLKKTAGKDKKKKKEIAQEVLRLERELEDRHSLELIECVSIAEESPVESAENSTSDVILKDKAVKPSKAQKRRERKANEDRERTQRIIEQEAENVNGPRNLELSAIKEILKKRKLAISNVPSDGDCLYRAIAHQLLVRTGEAVSVSDLRKRTASYVRRNKDDFIPFMSDQDTGDMLTDNQFDSYCDKIADTAAWGGQIEIRALSNLLKHPINVIQATGPEMISQGESFSSAPLVIAYHRHMYKLGEHYNSTRTLVNKNESDGDSPSEE